MKRTGLIILFVLAICVAQVALGQECIPRKELRDKHVVTYQSYNRTIRGCVVTPNFYTQQHKKGRGKLSRKFIIQVCEGEPRISPRIGNSFEICPYFQKPKQAETPED